MEPIVDFEGQPIVVGTVVRFDELIETERYPAQPMMCAVVTGISDVDGDVDDKGRDRTVNPFVSVRFADGTEQEFVTHWLGRWHDDDAPFEACDLSVAVHGPVREEAMR